MTNRYDATKPLLVIIGPSAVGKSTLAEELVKLKEPKFTLIKKYTTRPSRQSEKPGLGEDVYVSEEAFDEMDATGKFIQTVIPFGLKYKYGLPWIENIPSKSFPLVLLRSFVLEPFFAVFPNPIIYQLTTDKKTAITRMKQRGQTKTDIAARIEGFEREIDEGNKLASKSFENNNNLDSLARDIAKAYLEDIRSLL